MIKWLIGVLHDRYVYDRKEHCHIPEGTMKELTIFNGPGHAHRAMLCLRSRYGVFYWNATLVFDDNEVKRV